MYYGDGKAILILLLFSFLLCVFLQWVVSKLPAYPPPISVVWYTSGLLVALLAQWISSNLSSIITSIRNIRSAIFYYILLPILLYEATQNINWHKFRRFAVGGILLAIVGVGLQVVVLAVLFAATFAEYGDAHSKWSELYLRSFVIASAVSSTDPIAVLSVLSNMNAPLKLQSMFEGESLINDGSAVLLFQFSLSLLSGKSETVGNAILMLFRLLALGPLFGLCLGILVYVWLTLSRGFHLNQVLGTIVVCYLGFYVSEEHLGLSGPLTAVCYGLFIRAYGYIAFDRQAASLHHHFIESLALMANLIIFFFSGLITFGMMKKFVFVDYRRWWQMIVMYLYLNLARLGMLVLFMPILKRHGYGLRWKECILLFWGGLRGALVLALGLRIEETEGISAEYGEVSCFFISGNVLVFLFVNGITFEMLYHALNPYPPKAFRVVYLEKVMQMIDKEYEEEKLYLGKHWLFRNTNILEVADKMVPKLGWRKLDNTGNLTIKCPSVVDCFKELQGDIVGVWKCPSDSPTLPVTPHVLPKSQEFETGTKPVLLTSATKKHEFEGVFDPQFNLTLIGQATEDEPKVAEPGFLSIPHELHKSFSSGRRGVPLNLEKVPKNRFLPRFNKKKRGKDILEDDKSVLSKTGASIVGSLSNNDIPRFHTDTALIFYSSQNLHKVMDKRRRIESPNERYDISLLTKNRDAGSHQIHESSFDDLSDSISKKFSNHVKPMICLKQVKKEREGELFLLVFNACREMYRNLYDTHCVNGSCLLHLDHCLDLATDVVLGMVRRNPIEAWRDVFDEQPEEPWFAENSEIEIKLDTNVSGFHVEWQLLRSHLNCIKRHWLLHLPTRPLRSVLTFEACQSDIQQIVAFVDVHEELLELGGQPMINLLGPTLIEDYLRQIVYAKKFMYSVCTRYPDSFTLAAVKIGATILLNLKASLVNEKANKGLLLGEDKKKILQIFDEQHFRLDSYKPFFSWMIACKR